MSTEKLDNVEALKLGEDANNNEVEGALVHHAKIWTGISKAEPEPYIHPASGNANSTFLIEIQPTRLKDPVWLIGGWTNHPHLTRKGTPVQFSLDPSPDLTLKDKDGHVVAESRLGTMASAGNFEWVMRGQGILNSQGIPRTSGTARKNPAWREGLGYE